MNRHQRRKEARNPAPTACRSLDAPGLRQFEDAVALMKAGRWHESEFAHKRVLEKNPRHSPSLHHLGLIAFKLGLVEQAISALRLALEIEPHYHDARLNLAAILKMQGARSESLENCRLVATAEPHNASAHLELGNILKDMGDLPGAIDGFRRALALRPGVAVAEWSLAQCLADAGHQDESIEVCDKILSRDPKHSLACKLLVRTLASRGDLAEAHRAIEKYESSGLGRIALLSDAAIGLKSGGRSLQAIAFLREAIARNPASVDLLLQLGAILKDLGRYREAFDVLKEGLDRDPARADGFVTLGFALYGQGAIDGALSALRHAVALQPEFMAARIALGTVLQDAGMLEEALEVLNSALDKDPRNIELRLAITNVKRLMCNWDGLDVEEVNCISELRASRTVVTPFHLIGMSVSTGDMRLFGERYSDKIAQSVRASTVPHAYQTFVKPSDRIRIGYLSSDFYNHATSILLAEVLEMHDRERFEVVGYCHSPDDESALRRRMIVAFDRFERIKDIGHCEAAERIRSDGIEVLVDLKGYTRGARQEIPALRPAPVQVGYLGYPATSGAKYIDYILADAVVAPLAHQPQYSEQIIHLEHCYQPNDRHRKIDAGAVTRAACGLPDEGFVFCSFNNNFKLNRTFFAIWMSVLDRVPGSVLWLLPKSPAVRANLKKEAAAHGVDPSRIIFAETLPNDQHLARHAVADLFLDSLPCTAHTTASDALWAGLPLLTCLGSTFAGRVAASVLETAGLPELVALTLEEYKSTALRLALAPDEIAAIKAKISANRLTAPLFDTPKYVRSLESAYTQISQLYRSGQPPRSLSA
ncbi:MAG: tetratricopeptide repeat protein [Hyphomicrobium sp.]